MSRFDLVNRVLTAAALVALAVTLGVWLTRSPLTAAAAGRPGRRLPRSRSWHRRRPRPQSRRPPSRCPGSGDRGPGRRRA